MSTLQSFLDHLSALSPSSLLLLPTLITLLAFFSFWVYKDYHSWLSYGTGGTPPTPAGYLRMTKFRLNRAFSPVSLTDASPLSGSGPSFLKDALPDKLSGPAGRGTSGGKVWARPKMQARTLPQRQHVRAKLGEEAEERLLSLARRRCEAHPDVLVFGRSKTEGGSADAIYARPGLEGRGEGAKDGILGDEIAHFHPGENSGHVWLAEADAKLVVGRGWGERFPLSAMGRLSNGWVFLYAPETAGEVRVLEGIVDAGIGYLTGKRV